MVRRMLIHIVIASRELSIGQGISGVSFQLADRISRKLEAYATKNATVIVWPMLNRVANRRAAAVDGPRAAADDTFIYRRGERVVRLRAARWRLLKKSVG